MQALKPGLRVASLILAVSCAGVAQSAVVLYQQDFENPNTPPGFVDDGRDLSVQPVNALYGGQPSGFNFLQANTVETLEINGGVVFGSGYSDPSGRGGNYALGMLATVQDDLLGLTFDVGDFDFLNFSMTISSIDLDSRGGPFVAAGTRPEFRFALHDGATLGGTVLDSVSAIGVASPREVFAWTDVLGGLSTEGSSTGRVTLVIDLLAGGYAALDNFRIVASDTEGDLGNSVPLPGTLALLGIGFAGLVPAARRSRQRLATTPG